MLNREKGERKIKSLGKTRERKRNYWRSRKREEKRAIFPCLSCVERKGLLGKGNVNKAKEDPKRLLPNLLDG